MTTSSCLRAEIQAWDVTVASFLPMPAAAGDCNALKSASGGHSSAVDSSKLSPYTHVVGPHDTSM